MLNQVQQQDLDLWEIWIEYDQFNPHHFGTLYVLGEIFIDHQALPPFLEKITRIRQGKQLILRVPPRTKGPCRSKEVLYAEPITDLSQYTSVCIFAGDVEIARFTDIEIMI